MLADGFVNCPECDRSSSHKLDCSNGRTMTKANPAQYCIWCEEKLATKEQFPHCSRQCKALEREAKK